MKIIVSLVIGYLIVAFVQWQANAAEWSDEWRVFALLIGAWFFVMWSLSPYKKDSNGA